MISSHKGKSLDQPRVVDQMIRKYCPKNNSFDLNASYTNAKKNRT